MKIRKPCYEWMDGGSGASWTLVNKPSQIETVLKHWDVCERWNFDGRLPCSYKDSWSCTECGFNKVTCRIDLTNIIQQIYAHPEKFL